MTCRHCLQPIPCGCETSQRFRDNHVDDASVYGRGLIDQVNDARRELDELDSPSIIDLDDGSWITITTDRLVRFEGHPARRLTLEFKAERFDVEFACREWIHGRIIVHVYRTPGGVEYCEWRP